MNNFVDVKLKKYLPQLTTFLYHNELYFPREGTFEEDAIHCTDIVCSDSDFNDIRVGIRIRKIEYKKYNDWSIRSTEHPKLLKEDISLYLYCYEEEDILKQIVCINVPAIKKYIPQVLKKERQFKYNKDGTKFITIPFTQISQFIYVHRICQNHGSVQDISNIHNGQLITQNHGNHNQKMKKQTKKNKYIKE